MAALRNGGPTPIDRRCVLCVIGGSVVSGVTQLHGIVYIVCSGSSAIIRFNARTQQRLTDIIVKELRQPQDIAACEQTSVMYVADHPISDAECVWRVSSDGEDMKRWLQWSPSDTFSPDTLSVTSSRLLMTSRRNNQLRQFDAVGDELRQVDLPDDMKPQHAVESPTGTFIVSHFNTQLKQCNISEVSTGGQVLRQFSGSDLLPFSLTQHVAVDSQGNIFVADSDNSRILLFSSELTLRRVIIDEHQLKEKQPQRLCYTEQSGQLLVGFYGVVAVFDVLRR